MEDRPPQRGEGLPRPRPGRLLAIGAGPVFTTATTDQSAKGVVALVILFSLLDIAVRARRFDARHAVEAYDRRIDAST